MKKQFSQMATQPIMLISIKNMTQLNSLLVFRKRNQISIHAKIRSVRLLVSQVVTFTWLNANWFCSSVTIHNLLWQSKNRCTHCSKFCLRNSITHLFPLVRCGKMIILIMKPHNKYPHRQQIERNQPPKKRSKEESSSHSYGMNDGLFYR